MELPQVLGWLVGEESEELESVPTAGEQAENVVVEEVATLVLPGATTSFMDRIRFAAANRLLIRLGYSGEYRDIEPYALARSSEGKILVQSIRSVDGESAAIDLIEWRVSRYFRKRSPHAMRLRFLRQGIYQFIN